MSGAGDWLQWLNAVILPGLAGLFWQNTKTKDELAQYKVHVAENYAPKKLLSDLEEKIDKRFDRLEIKLDKLGQD